MDFRSVIVSLVCYCLTYILLLNLNRHWRKPRGKYCCIQSIFFHSILSVITGATDGIGREYARGLAKRRINVVLISRTESKLIEMCKEIKVKYGVKAKYIVADFTRGPSIYANIEQTLKDVPVGILGKTFRKSVLSESFISINFKFPGSSFIHSFTLSHLPVVNNVGVAVEYPDELHKLPQQILWDTVNVNVAACTILTRIVAPGMVERGRGAIVNISSGSEMQPTPLMNIYSASKSYVRMLTLAIERELAPHGVTVQLVSPMFLVTKLNRFSTTLQSGGFFIPDVESYTAAALNKLGKTPRTNGYFAHSIQYAFIKMVPEWLRTRIGERLGRQFNREYWEQIEQGRLQRDKR